MRDPAQADDGVPPIFIVSGGAGALGKHVARIALSQFPGLNPQVVVIPQVSRGEQLPAVIEQVAARRGLIIHTMVDTALRAELLRAAAAAGIETIDTIGDPLERLGMIGRYFEQRVTS